jgi:hypothetical protein
MADPRKETAGRRVQQTKVMAYLARQRCPDARADIVAGKVLQPGCPCREKSDIFFIDW